MNLITHIFIANFVCQNFIAMKKLITLFAVAGVIASSCNKPEPPPIPEPDNDPGQTEQPNEPVKIPIKLSASITSKATDAAFEDGDEIGIYVVNYDDDTAGTLANSGNHLNNTKFTLNGTEWETAKEEYWLDQKTKADFYCYYPYTASITDITAVEFTVKEDQSTYADYKASELLYGKTEGAAPSENPVQIQTKHALSNIIVYVTPGKGYTEETLAEEEISVTITGVKTKASLNLKNGSVTAEGSAKDITPYKESTWWRALVVPQDIIGTQIIKVTVGQNVYTLNQTVTFIQNTQHKCTVVVNKISEGVNISIGGWESADTDFGGTLD